MASVPKKILHARNKALEVRIVRLESEQAFQAGQITCQEKSPNGQ